MSAAPAPLVPADQERLAALRRLDVVDTAPEERLDAAVRLVADVLGAHAAALTLVPAEHAWSKAATFGQRTVDHAASPAARAVVAAEGFVALRVVADDPLASHPALAGCALPATCAAVVIRAPEGESVGALEVWWPGDPPVTRSSQDLLERFAGHLGHLLELRAEASEYRRFVELSPDAVTVLDVEGAIVVANPALATLLGLEDPQQLIGQRFFGLVDGRDRARATAELTRVLTTTDSRTAQLDLQLRRTDGELVTCSVSAAHLRGARRHLQLVVHDLSERLRGEEERSRLSEQLARAERLDAVGRVAGGLAHDLNNLLVVMVSNLSLAQEALDELEAGCGPAPIVSVRQDLEELGIAVDRAGQLTGKLLEFARRPDGEYEVADVEAAVGTVHRLIGRSLGAGVRMLVELGDDLPRVAADPTKLERVLVNLVMNARDAMAGGGTVQIVARSLPAGAAEAGEVGHAGPVRAGVLLEVVDDGRGMEPGVRARAFEPLFTTKGEGTGLGLATVAAFAEEVDGQVRLVSVPGEGTRVSLVLPAARAPEEVYAVGADASVGGVQVLLVDPGERTRRVITRMLQGAGYRVRAVGSGEEAMTALCEQPMDLVITELALPGMTGVRFLDEIRAHDPRLRAVALAMVDASMTIDRTPVLVKPFSHTRLLRTVEAVMRGS